LFTAIKAICMQLPSFYFTVIGVRFWADSHIFNILVVTVNIAVIVKRRSFF